MAGLSSLPRAWSSLCAAFIFCLATPLLSFAQAPSQPQSGAKVVVGVAIDESDLAATDLQRSKEFVLALASALPPGSKIALAGFSGEKRIILPLTADKAEIEKALSSLKPGASGVALPDGLFDLVDYIGQQDAAARSVLLISEGRVKEGDLQFEDPLNAASLKKIPIFAVGAGQGDGKTLRRVAKITGGEYVRLEVADAAVLAASFMPRPAPAAEASDLAAPEPSPTPIPRGATGLLGAAAIFFSIGGLLMLGIVVLMIRRMRSGSDQDVAPTLVQSMPPRDTSSRPSPSGSPRAAAVALAPKPDDDDPVVDRTLVVNANPTLRALSGPGAGRNFPLSASGTTSLGRSRRNDIVVPEDAASAQHCRIDREGDSYVVHDLGSTNGTWVNGARTDRALLQHGDRLKVGETVFAVSLFGDRN